MKFRFPFLERWNISEHAQKPPTSENRKHKDYAASVFYWWFLTVPSTFLTLTIKKNKKKRTI
jgi:hypothetical protein